MVEAVLHVAGIVFALHYPARWRGTDLAFF
jgi:hypothetical protein